MMDIHPEVSTGVIDSLTGIPSQSTTEVTTRLIVPDGKTIFVGGLIKHRVDESKHGIPIIGRIPGIGRLFSNRQKIMTNSETVVLIKPTVVGTATRSVDVEAEDKIELMENGRAAEAERLADEMELFFGAAPDTAASQSDGQK